MKPTLNLYFDFEFTSISPDTQPISLGIVSDEVAFTFKHGHSRVTMNDRIPISKSFYAVFSDFDINRCGGWIRENVILISNLLDKNGCRCPDNGSSIYGDTSSIIRELKKWLSQFSDYNLQFICDCGTWDWYWMLQLIGKWNTIENENSYTGSCPTCGTKGVLNYKTGHPKLPPNISPVPFDLNDLIAIKQGITPKEAFDLDREKFIYENVKGKEFSNKTFRDNLWNEQNQKHNSLWDSEVIKTIYNKLKNHECN